MGDRVAVVGAGYAGMAAAVTLAERGIPVTVFESGPLPGGRARRVVSQGYSVDNGQHVLIGAYTELFRLMRLVGVPQDALLRLPLEIRYAKDFSFRAFWFPAPFGLLAGLLAARGVPFSERVGAVRFMLALQKAAFRLDQDISFNQLLETHRQDGAIGHYLWRPLCVSALNTPAAQASANVFLAVLRPGAGDAASAPT
jgi:predicted NAD/FAD-binding protein